MDHTTGPLSGTDSTSFHADSTSIFATTSVGAPLPPLPSFESSNNSGPEFDPDLQAEMPGQSGLLERGNAGRSSGNLDAFAGAPNQTHSIEFRVARADSPVRRLRLTGNRYTFGSAEGCSIRLNDPSLRPMHAVLTRDMDRVVVRAYSVPIEVNENRVTETTLAVGDHLRLGAYEFELLSITTNSAPSPSSSLDPKLRVESPAVSSHRIDQNGQDETVWRQRLRKEIDQWRSKQVECDRRESLCDEREAHLRGRESEIWSRAENLYRREAKIQDQESAVYQMHDDYAERQQELLKLREDTNNKQRQFAQRESEFARQESEYRQQLEEATAHLLQSQAQATAATEAVQEMRQQFDALNEQIEELSSHQNDLKRNEETERDENQRMRSDLESQRDAAIDAQAEGEARRREAVQRVDEMTAELESLRRDQAESGEVENQKLTENEATIESLRTQVEGLQDTVDEASEEANRLRSDYRDALDSVRQLEHLVAQSNQRGDTDRDQWSADADSLRAEIESLSGDLERTREEINELRQANQSLTTRLQEVETQRDHAVQEISDRPTREAFDHLRDELENANQTLADLRLKIVKSDDHDSSNVVEDARPESASSYDALDSDDANNQKDSTDEPEASHLSVWNLPEGSLTDDISISGSSDEAVESDESAVNEMAASATVEHELVESEEPISLPSDVESSGNETSGDESLDDESPDEIWPTYQVSEPITSDSEQEPEQHLAEPNFATPSATADISQDDVADHSQSIWNLEPSADQSQELIENTGIWNPDSADESFSEVTSNVAEDGFPTSEANQKSLNTGDVNHDDVPEPQSSLRNPSATKEPDAMEGSLASLLIADLDNAEDLPSDVQPESINGDVLNGDVIGEDVIDEEHGVQSEIDDDAPFAPSGSHQGDLVPDSAVTGSESEDEDEPVGLMSLLADDELSDDHRPNNSSEDALNEGSSGESAAWDREYHEESDSHRLDEPESSSVWDLNENETDESDSLIDEYNQTEAISEFAEPEPESESPQERVEMTAMMPSMDELEAEEPVEVDSYASYQQQSESFEPATAVSSELNSSPEPDNRAAQEVDSDANPDDDSIEAYMNRLLGRVQGTSGTDEASASDSVSLSTSSVSLEPSPESDSTSGSSPMAPQPEIDPDAPLVPRSHAPERNSDLSAMRDLANQSARTAISRSTRIQTRNMQMAGVMNFGVALVAVLFGFGASFLLGGGLLYLAWGMVVIISVISIRDGLRNLSDARTRTRAAERGELPEAILETAPDPDQMAANAEDRLARQNAAAKAVREQH